MRSHDPIPRSPGSLLVLTLLLVAVQSGCGGSAAYPKAPKIRIEGPAGAQVGYGVTYFDGKDSIDATGGVKLIPESGVYSEDLKNGHRSRARGSDPLPYSHHRQNS